MQKHWEKSSTFNFNSFEFYITKYVYLEEKKGFVSIIKQLIQFLKMDKTWDDVSSTKVYKYLANKHMKMLNIINY